MASVQNGSLINRIAQKLKLSPGGVDKLPVTSKDFIYPIVDLTSPSSCDITAIAGAANAATATIYTTPTDKDFFLSSLSLSWVKDVTSTSTLSGIQVSINGSYRYLIQIIGFTLTPINESVTQSFPIPVKIDRGTAILLYNGSAVANSTSVGSIIGFTEEIAK